MAHLRHRGHSPRFWALHRTLLDEAQAAGLYSSELDDVHESSRGAEKLAGSAGHAVAQAAATRRRERAARNRAAAQRWSVGDVARVTLTRGALAGVHVKVLGIARSWLTVETPMGKRYRVAALVLATAEEA
jgi:hypothetical protein